MEKSTSVDWCEACAVEKDGQVPELEAMDDLCTRHYNQWMEASSSEEESIAETIAKSPRFDWCEGCKMEKEGRVPELDGKEYLCLFHELQRFKSSSSRDTEIPATVVQPQPADGHGEPVTETLLEWIGNRYPRDEEGVKSTVQGIVQRSVFGLQKYGTVLKTRNGRDPVVDCSQEVWDGLQYAMQAKMEGKDLTELKKAIFILYELVDADIKVTQPTQHPPTEECPDEECQVCSIRDCPSKDPLHYHHDGCTSCWMARSDVAEVTRYCDRCKKDTLCRKRRRVEYDYTCLTCERRNMFCGEKTCPNVGYQCDVESHLCYRD